MRSTPRRTARPCNWWKQAAPCTGTTPSTTCTVPSRAWLRSWRKGTASMWKCPISGFWTQTLRGRTLGWWCWAIARSDRREDVLLNVNMYILLQMNHWVSTCYMQEHWICFVDIIYIFDLRSFILHHSSSDSFILFCKKRETGLVGIQVRCEYHYLLNKPLANLIWAQLV